MSSLRFWAMNLLLILIPFPLERKQLRHQVRRCTWKMCISLSIFPSTTGWIKPLSGLVTSASRSRCSSISSGISGLFEPGSSTCFVCEPWLLYSDWHLPSPNKVPVAHLRGVPFSPNAFNVRWNIPSQHCAETQQKGKLSEFVSGGAALGLFSRLSVDQNCLMFVVWMLLWPRAVQEDFLGIL